MRKIDMPEMSEMEQSILIPITYFSDKLPYRTALNKCSKHISLLADLYKAIGEKTSSKRYGQCWDYFPSDLTEEDLLQIISTLRIHLNSRKEKTSLTIMSLNREFFYENIARQQLKKMLHCAFALKQDLQTLKRSIQCSWSKV